MKKLIFLINLLLVIFLVPNVYAKDTIYSLNKYKEEKYSIIKESYNKNGKSDGFIVAGEYLKETIEQNDKSYDNHQIMVVKYDVNGKLKWFYDYGKTSEDTFYSLNYSYTDNNIDGYYLLVNKTTDINEELDNTTSKTTFIKISLDGKQILEKPTSNNPQELINKLIPVYTEDNNIDSYIGIGTSDNKALLVKYDKELNVIYTKEYEEENKKISFNDITTINDNNKTIGYVTLKKYQENDNETISLVHYDLDGNEVKTITESLEKYENLSFESSSSGYLLLGATKEVKLKNGNTSFFILKYNSNDEEEWETIGDIPIDPTKKIVLFSQNINDKIEYFLMYNRLDKFIEVIKLDSEGMIKEKIKKINTEYYSFENFYTKNNILYLIGQITCSKEDMCDYDSNSLFLISDEDKVIEVEEKDSESILIVLGIITIILAGIIIYKRKRQ